MSTENTPHIQRRVIAYQHLHDAVADARDLRSGYWKAGQWSLSQILDHLIKTMRISFDGIDWGLPRLARPIVRLLYVKKVRTGRSDAIGLRAAAPPALQPPPAADVDADVDEKLIAFAELAEKIESPDAVFIDSHPVFGRLAPDDWRWVQRWHCAHHLSYLSPREDE